MSRMCHEYVTNIPHAFKKNCQFWAHTCCSRSVLLHLNRVVLYADRLRCNEEFITSKNYFPNFFADCPATSTLRTEAAGSSKTSVSTCFHGVGTQINTYISIAIETSIFVTQFLKTYLNLLLELRIRRQKRVAYEICHFQYCLLPLIVSVRVYIYIYRKYISELILATLWWVDGTPWVRCGEEVDGARNGAEVYSTSEYAEQKPISVGVYRCMNVKCSFVIGLYTISVLFCTCLCREVSLCL